LAILWKLGAKLRPGHAPQKLASKCHQHYHFLA
jgi:hypothetical protein